MHVNTTAVVVSIFFRRVGSVSHFVNIRYDVCRTSPPVSRILSTPASTNMLANLKISCWFSILVWGCKSTPSSGMQYTHRKLHLQGIQAIRNVPRSPVCCSYCSCCSCGVGVARVARVVGSIKVRLLFLVLTRRAQRPTGAAGRGEKNINIDAQYPATGNRELLRAVFSMWQTLGEQLTTYQCIREMVDIHCVRDKSYLTLTL